jgi:hypothetical protein
MYRGVYIDMLMALHQITVRVNDRELELLEKWTEEDLLPTASQVAKMMMKKAIKLREVGKWE